jgi:hypothetical protein
VVIIFALGQTTEFGVKLAQERTGRGGGVPVCGEEREATDKLLPFKIDAVPEGWDGITSFLVTQARTLWHGGKDRKPAAAEDSVRGDGTAAERPSPHEREPCPI